MKEQEYEDILFGKVPSSWEIVKLGSFAEIETGKRPRGGGLDKGNIASIGGEHIDKDGKVLWDDVQFIPKNFYKSLRQGKLEQGDILIVKDGATTGKTAILRDMLYKKATVNEHVFVIKSKVENKIHNEFLFYVLFSKIGQNQMKRIFHGMVGGVRKRNINLLKIPLPSLSEQRKIASILSTVDEAIQLADEAIAKTERLRRGLIQELLTKGIGHKEFKDTEIGRIPKSWKIAKLRDVAEVRKSKEYNQQEVPFIPMKLIPDSGIFANYEIRPTDKIRSYTYCEKGDLLLAKITPSLENGKQGLVPENIPNDFALATTEVFPIACQEELEKLFLFYILKFPKFRKILEHQMRGTTGRQRVPETALKNLKIPFPQSSEQRKSASILSTVDEKLELEKQRKEKFRKIKKGLMHELLTGRKRFKIDEGGAIERVETG